MTMNGPNQGIYMTGGTIHAQALAVGVGARATTVAEDLRARGKDEVAQRLDEFVAQLEAHADEVPGIEDVLGATETVTEELAKERPNKTTVTGVLSGIATSVQSVSGLATAVDELLKVVQGIF
jgi:hypothetical protein